MRPRVIDVDEDRELVLDRDLDVREEIGQETADELLAFLGELGIARGEDEESSLRDLLYRTRMSSLPVGPPGWFPLLRPRDLLGLRVEGGAVRARRWTVAPSRGFKRTPPPGHRADDRGRPGDPW